MKIVLEWLKPIDQKLNTLYNKLKNIEEVQQGFEKSRKYLVAYQWKNDMTGASGHSSTIITLQKNEVMDDEMIKQLQNDILKAISRAGHPNDPDEIVITHFSRLEIK